MPKVKTSWKKGQSGNPNGRPKKGYSITEWFQEMLNSNPQVRDELGKAIMEKALKGDIAAQKIIWNYMDGQPKQSHEITGKDGEPLYPEPIYGSKSVNPTK